MIKISHPFEAARTPAPTLLYIDDDAANTELMEYILALRPAVRLVTAATGAAGITLAKQERPDLVLLDFHLPDMNGVRVLECLQADPTTAEIPVAMVSGDATASRIEQLISLGARDYVTKPFSIVSFLDRMDDLLRGGVKVALA